MLCGDCTKLVANCALGIGKECGHTTTSRGFAYCPKCSEEKGVCERCGKEIEFQFFEP